MEDKFYKVDLHIHSPSSDCYKGPKNDDEYFSILQRCKEKGLRVVAITDHNSIDGHKKFFRLKEKLLEEKNSLSLITDSAQAKDKVKLINSKLNLFDDILLLPGVEIEVSNGIHLLGIFNPETDIEKIESFLINAGYGGDKCGKEMPDVVSNWDIFHLYEESKNMIA